MPSRARVRLTALLLALAGGGTSWAQDVVLSGVSSGRALLVIDGGPPRFLATGQSRDGVRVVSVGSDSAVVEVGGRRQELRLGQAPMSSENSPSADNSRIVLQADGRGHFVTNGQINGKAMQFMLDTGATLVILGKEDADRIGVRESDGQPVRVVTANGTAQGRQIRLPSVRVGAVQVYDVPGLVMPHAMPFVLLGNSFLSRFQMQRNNDQMVLEKRF